MSRPYKENSAELRNLLVDLLLLLLQLTVLLLLQLAVLLLQLIKLQPNVCCTCWSFRCC